MEKYKKIFTPVLFLTILIILLKATSIIFAPKNSIDDFAIDEINTNGILGEEINSIDVIIIGDSETYNSFSPLQMYEEQGFTTYVCGTPAQKMYDSYAYFERALEYQDPKVVVLETNAIFRKYSLYNIIGSEATKAFPIVKYHNRWKTLTINDFTGDVSYTYTEPLKGFKINRNVNSTNNKDYMTKNDRTKEIPVTNLKYIDQMRMECAKRGIKLVLMSSASIKNWNYAKHRTIEEYAKKYYIDYYDINMGNVANIDWTTDTADKGDHVNFYGAQKVSSYVSSLLKRNYDLPDHRNDIYYQKWNQDLKKYYKLIG